MAPRDETLADLGVRANRPRPRTLTGQCPDWLTGVGGGSDVIRIALAGCLPRMPDARSSPDVDAVHVDVEGDGLMRLETSSRNDPHAEKKQRRYDGHGHQHGQKDGDDVAVF